MSEHDGPLDGDSKDPKDSKLPAFTVSRVNLNVPLRENDDDERSGSAGRQIAPESDDEDDYEEFSWRTLPRYVRRLLVQSWDWIARNLSMTHVSLSGAYLLYHLWQSWKESRAQTLESAASAAAAAAQERKLSPVNFVDRLNAHIRWLIVGPLKALVSFCKWLWNSKYDNLARAFMVLLLIVAFSLLPALESMVRRAVDRWLYGHDGAPPPPPKPDKPAAQSGNDDVESPDDDAEENGEQAVASGGAAKQRGFVFE